MKFSKIYVEITNYCNLHCSFCSKDKREKREMTLDEFSMVIEKIKNYTESIYLHIKGEPLLHSRLDEILTICDNNDIKVRITTNGTLLEEKINILLKHHIKQINISLHCENKKEDYLYKVFVASSSLTNMNVIYRIWTLPSMNLDKASTIIVDNLIKYYNLSTKIVNKIYHDKNIKLGDNIYLDKDYEFVWPNDSVSNNDIGTCLGTRSHIGILSNGVVVPCCLDSEGSINLGNIFDNSMEDVLNNYLFKEISNGFINGKIVCDLCKKCTYRNRFSKK